MASPNRPLSLASEYSGLNVSEVHRLRELEKQNSRLKRLGADRDLEIDTMKELLTRKWQALRSGAC
jgi:putative transposase